jgi:hypothetical protein
MKLRLVLLSAVLAGVLGVAVGAAAQVAVPAPAVAPTSPPPAPLELTVARVPAQTPTSTVQADAEVYVSLARQSLAACGPAGVQPPVALQQQYTAALGDLEARRYASAEAASRALVDECAAAFQLANGVIVPTAMPAK